MKFLKKYLIAALLVSCAHAENLTRQNPITMRQLMRELRIDGGNFTFSFDQPVYARITTTTTQYPDGEKTREIFISDTPSNIINLFFTKSPLFVGDYPRGDISGQLVKMKIKLSNCEATKNTRIVHYVDKFAENKYRGGLVFDGRPQIALHPKLNEEYALHMYGKEGDSYDALATICFVADPKDFTSVPKFQKDKVINYPLAEDSE